MAHLPCDLVVVLDHAEMARQVRFCFGPISTVPTGADVIHAGKHQAGVKAFGNMLRLTSLIITLMKIMLGVYWSHVRLCWKLEQA